MRRHRVTVQHVKEPLDVLVARLAQLEAELRALDVVNLCRTTTINWDNTTTTKT